MIDGYSHCGISKYRPVEDVLAVMQSAGVDRAVLCQHLGEYDNTYMAEVVGKYTEKLAAICLVDPTSPTASADLKECHQTGKFRGVRLLTEWLEHESLWAQAADLGLTLVLYSPQGTAAAAPAIRKFAKVHPSARIVLTHLGNPLLQNGQPADMELLRLVDLPGMFVQLSGLSQFCEYPHTELNGLVPQVVREFGAPRVYWGSNYPVCGDVAAYRRDLALVMSGAWGLAAEEIEWITERTAKGLWFPVGNPPI
jgi:L-fuconolactonase